METKAPAAPQAYTAVIDGKTYTVAAPDIVAAYRKAGRLALGGAATVAWPDRGADGVVWFSATRKADRAKAGAEVVRGYITPACFVVPAAGPEYRAPRMF